MVTGEDIAHSEELAGHGEPWEAWETKLVAWSISIAVVGLVILGWVINTYILSKIGA